jgi:pentatricopeptide repeat protein
VQVTGFTENAPTLVQYGVKVGDRVLAVDSSLGDRMWPVSTVEGVISAVTSRLPGQQITMRFQRPAANMVDDNDTTTPVVLSSATAATSTKETTITTTTKSTNVQVDQKELLKRCREILKRYMSEEQQQVRSKFVEKYAVPAMVADKVMDALSSANATVDSVTLSMIMSAYLSCRQAHRAIVAFETATGLNADGSPSEPLLTLVTQQQQDNKQIVPNADALNAFTASALLKAHAINGDLASVQRVLAALEGESSKEVQGLPVASWPGTGSEGVVRPDTRFYNIAISAAAESCLDDGLIVALDIFDRMRLPTTVNEGGTPARDLVTYNTVINALSQFGKYEEAIALFYDMKSAGVKPDKYSYTALVKAVVVHDGDVQEFFDVQELLYDMKEQGVQADTVTYNTIIKAMCQERKIVAAKKMVNQMEAAGVSPDSNTYGLLMSALLKSGNPRACVTLFESACADRRTVALTENVHLYTTAITAASALGDHDRALDLLSRMNSIGVKANMKTLTALVGACLASGKPDLAVNMYKRIDSPDGYATLQGLRALSESGNIEEGLSIVNKGRKALGVTGKQFMMMYETMISNALQQSDYDMARRVLTDLLQKSNIPSKALFQTMFSSMKILVKKRKALITMVDVDEEADAKFSFLLYVLDSVQKRNLPCEGSLYTTILFYGAQLGSLPRKISALLAYARMASQMEVPATVSETLSPTLQPVTSWEAAFNKYDELKQQLRDPMALPSLNVRIATADIPKVLAAEQTLSYSGERRPRRQEV